MDKRQYCVDGNSAQIHLEIQHNLIKMLQGI